MSVCWFVCFHNVLAAAHAQSYITVVYKREVYAPPEVCVLGTPSRFDCGDKDITARVSISTPGTHIKLSLHL